MLLIEFFDELNATRNWDRFARKVRERYSEATLQRLLASKDPKTRHAVLVALSAVGTMESNKAVAAHLGDEVEPIRELAEATLWAIWFRGDAPANSQELQRLVKLVRDEQFEKALEGLNALVAKAPKFAEAANQRAIVYFRLREYRKSIEDCERVIRLNPHHFGAASGMAQCYHELKKPAEELKALKLALKIHPGLDGAEHRIRELERTLKNEK